MAGVVVVGAGIVGAAVAYEAVRAGAEVALLEKSLPASGVTGDSFAWIGGPRGKDVPDASTPLRDRVLHEYRRLEEEVPGLLVRWRGSLHCDDEGAPSSDPSGPTSACSGRRRSGSWSRTCGIRRLGRCTSAVMGPSIRSLERRRWSARRRFTAPGW